MKKIFFIFLIFFFSVSVFAVPYSVKKIDNSGKYARLITTYPKFIGNSPLIILANKEIPKIISETVNTNKTFIKEYGDSEGYINTAYATVVRCDSKIISVVWQGDWCAGGVHNDIIMTASFGMINNKAKILTVHDLGDPVYFAKEIIKEYKSHNKKLEMLSEGTFTEKAILEEENQCLLNSFTVSDRFITFYRKEYQFGYGYEGADFVKIKINQTNLKK